MRRKHIAILTIAAVTTPLLAQNMMLQSDERSIETLAEYQTVDDQFGFDSRTRTPDAPFDDWLDTTSINIGRADANAAINSSISSTAMQATGSADAHAIFDVDTSVFTIAFATSRHIVAFELAQDTTFALVADLIATSNAESFITLRQDTRFGAILHEYAVTDDELSIDDQITLSAGTYYLEFRAESNHEHHSPAETTGNASFDAAWSVVPAPATTALLAIALMPRRRRQAR